MTFGEKLRKYSKEKGLHKRSLRKNRIIRIQMIESLLFPDKNYDCYLI